MLSVVRWVEDSPAIVVTQSRSTATEMVVPEIVWMQPPRTMTVNIPDANGVDHGLASSEVKPGAYSKARVAPYCAQSASLIIMMLARTTLRLWYSSTSLPAHPDRRIATPVVMKP